jgi:hypothetical protein
MQDNTEILNSLKNLLAMPQRYLGKEIKDKLFVLELGIEQVDYSRYSLDAVGCRGLPYEEWDAQRKKYSKEPFKIMVTKIADIDKYEKHINEWNQEMYRDIIRLSFREIKTLFEEIKDFRRILEGASRHIEDAKNRFDDDMYFASTGGRFRTLETMTQEMNGVITNYKERSFSLHNFKNWVLPLFGYPALEPISFEKGKNLKGVNDIGEHQEGSRYYIKPKFSTVSTYFDFLDIDFKINGETVFITTLLLENVKKIIGIRKYVVIDLLEKITNYLRLHGELEEPAPALQEKGKPLRNIKTAKRNHRIQINEYLKLRDEGHNYDTILIKMSRRTDLGANGESEKSRKDAIQKNLKLYDL